MAALPLGVSRSLIGTGQELGGRVSNDGLSNDGSRHYSLFHLAPVYTPVINSETATFLPKPDETY